MNASRLLEIVDLIIAHEDEAATESRLSDVSSALGQLVSSPAEPSYQQSLSSSIEKLKEALDLFIRTFQPAQVKLLEEIGAGPYFVEDIAGEIQRWMSDGPATPAVAQDKLAKLIKIRSAFISEIKSLRASLLTIGIKKDELEPGQAEVGFLLPRDLFENHLDKLIDELRFIKRAVRAFSEAATGSAEPIEVRQISTTDPQFFFGLSTATIALLGLAVNWALSTWRQVEDIRRIRAETEKIAAFKEDPIAELFDAKINKVVGASIDAKVQEILDKVDGRDGRKHEQATDLKWALESILARVERGMTVEIRLLPPAISDGGDDAAAAKIQFDDLKQVADQLVFPKMAGDPVLALPPVERQPQKQGRRAPEASG
ncbi:hypothetical protein [Mesorhizobium loti]|uniref:Uncharacterized protein n=1 Tax=Mesorhizobium loti R88b TaxID=935548 RepID=A0A6M7WMY3_RHILI|nr:hypothetical protein [Mesorhizobium loti]QKD02213.1 hypothetical protein EB235_12460 [Mesorhizobium loti R88b]